MMSYNNIFLLRHLKTQNNELHIISGQSDSEIIEADCTKFDLSKFDEIYCSFSPRCKRTLEILGEQPVLSSYIKYDERLIERNMGKLEGIAKKRGEKIYPDLFREEAFNVFKTPPQGESYESFKKRVEDFYKEKLKLDKGLKILICSHNQTLKLLRLLILEEDITYLSWSAFSFNNGELVKIK